MFKEGLVENHAQIRAFEDSWHWSLDTERTFEELIGVRPSKTEINQDVSDLMQGFQKILGKNDIMAYLVMMTIRLIELHSVLKNTGSFYLHCDPTASHYLKIVMDSIFGVKNFRNEIVWRYGQGGKSKRQWGKKHDIILFYTKSNEWLFNSDDVREPMKSGVTSFGGRLETDSDGRKYRLVYGTKNSKGKTKYYKYYLDEGKLPEDVFDIPSIQSGSKERLGYPTQKPETLLERIIKASSNEGDWVLDPFCGCGTTVSVAEKLNRNWIGIDITTLAINLIRHRLNKQFEQKFYENNMKITVDGLPRDLEGAKMLSEKDPFEFEYWVLDMVGAMPAKGKSKGKMRGADKGVDGIITFKDIGKKKNEEKVVYKKVVVQVKGGHVQRNDIATLKGDVERENAEGGILITLQKATRSMVDEVGQAGHFKTNFGTEFPKIQIITIEDLLNGESPDIPQYETYYKIADKYKSRTKKMQTKLEDMLPNNRQ